jgi:hypothetical protein
MSIIVGKELGSVMTYIDTDSGKVLGFVVSTRVSTDKNEYNQHRTPTLDEAQELQHIIHEVAESYFNNKKDGEL